MITIASLIYCSPRYADMVWDSVHKCTPHLYDARARFFFVANDATEEVRGHLLRRNLPHVVQENRRLNPSELDAAGFKGPEYIRRVYQGYNRAIMEADERVVLVNSDHVFSPGWLDGLLTYSTPERIVCSKLVERSHPRFSRFLAAYNGEFGDINHFNEQKFLEFAQKMGFEGHEGGGAFMPCLFYRYKAIEAGLYPEGNPKHAKSGDRAFFKALESVGVKHVTALNSIVYHFKEGEKEDEKVAA